MAINKVIYGNDTLIDLTEDTVSASNLLSGETAHDRSGATIQGTVTVPDELNDLDDVNISSVTDGQALVYDSTSSKWVNGNVATSTDITNAINALDGGTIGTPSTSKTVTALSESNGNISATFGDIQIAESQVTNLTTDLGKKANLASPTFTGTPKAPTAALGTDTTQIATTAFVQDAIEALPEPMVFKGSLGTGGTITALPVDGSASRGDTYKVITAGTYAGQAADVGDTFICETKTSSANTWAHIPSGDEPSGTVTSITIKATSPISVDSSSAITTSGTRTISHATSGATAGSYGDSSAQTPAYGDTFKVPYVTVNDTGHVTSISEHTVKIPANPVNNKTITIQKNGTDVDSFTLNQSTDKSINITMSKSDVGLGNVPNVTTNNQTPTFTQASTRANIASGEKLSVIFGKIMKWFADLKTVAFTGSYSDLSDTPTIPTVNNATLTIQKNGTTVQTFTANASQGKTANITVPTALSDLTDDSTHRVVTDTQISGWDAKSSLTLGETSATAYRGDRGKAAYTHASDSNRLTIATASGLYKVASTNQGHIASLTAIQKSDITGLGIPAQDTTYTFATGDTFGSIKVDSTDVVAQLNATTVSTKNTDLDDYKTAGEYFFTSTYTPTNVPTGVTNGVLIVITFGTNGVKQIWLRQGTKSTNDHETYIRMHTGSTWGSWKRFAITDDIKTYTGTGLISVNSSTNEISTTAEVNQNAFSNISLSVGGALTVISASTKQDTFGLVAGSEIELSLNDKAITINSSDQKLRQTVTNSGDNNYRVLLTYATPTTTQEAAEARFSSRFYYNTSTKLLITTDNTYYSGIAPHYVYVGDTSAMTGARLYASGDQDLWLQSSNEASTGVKIGVYETTSAWAFAPMSNNTMRLGSPSLKWSVVYATNSAINTSDRNEKEDIVDLDSEFAKDFIMDLKPVSYKRIEGDRTHYGLIAQDVEETLDKFDLTSMDFGGLCKDQKVEQIYTEDEEGNPHYEQKEVNGEFTYGLRYEEFIAPLIKTVQLQQQEIELLKQEIELLKQK